MDDAVVGQDVGRDDLGRVDKQAVARVGESQPGAVEGGQAGVSEGAGVKWTRALDDVVLQNLRQLASRHIGVLERASHHVEGIVVGDEHGHVAQAVEAGAQVGAAQGTSSGCQVQVRKGAGVVNGESQDAVDDVDDTARVVDVLGVVSVNWYTGSRDDCVKGRVGNIQAWSHSTSPSDQRRRWHCHPDA